MYNNLYRFIYLTKWTSHVRGVRKMINGKFWDYDGFFRRVEHSLLEIYRPTILQIDLVIISLCNNKISKSEFKII